MNAEMNNNDKTQVMGTMFDDGATTIAMPKIAIAENAAETRPFDFMENDDPTAIDETIAMTPMTDAAQIPPMPYEPPAPVIDNPQPASDTTSTMSIGKIAKWSFIIAVVVMIAFAAIAPEVNKILYGPEPAVSSSLMEKKQTEDNASSPTESEPEKDTKDILTSDLADQKWSNAKKLLEARGATANDYIVLTYNGKTPINYSNWTVMSVTKDDSGKLVVNLKQDVDTTKQWQDAGNTAKEKAQDLGSQAQQKLNEYLQNHANSSTFADQQR